MADELTTSFAIEYSKGGRVVARSKTGVQIDVSGTDYVTGTQTIATTEEALNKGDITTIGWVFITNKDTTNYVTYRAATGGADCVKIKAGETVSFRAASNTPYMIANTASVEIDYVLIED